MGCLPRLEVACKAAVPLAAAAADGHGRKLHRLVLVLPLLLLLLRVLVLLLVQQGWCCCLQVQA
jgi:hypothetical protein